MRRACKRYGFEAEWVYFTAVCACFIKIVPIFYTFFSYERRKTLKSFFSFPILHFLVRLTAIGRKKMHKNFDIKRGQLLKEKETVRLHLHMLIMLVLFAYSGLFSEASPAAESSACFTGPSTGFWTFSSGASAASSAGVLSSAAGALSSLTV